MSGFKGKVALVGAGHTKWGVRNATWRELAQEAGRELFKAVPNLDRANVDSLFVGAAQPERWAFQSHVAPLVADMLGMVGRRGGRIGVCGTCMEARGIADAELVDGAQHSSMAELTEWHQWADEVAVF